MSIQNIRKEVMKTLEKNIDTFVDKFLIPAEKIWQPTDFLPNSQKDTFIDEIKEIQELSKDLSDDFWVVLVGDTITEEALPTYESWLLDIDGISQQPDNGWAKWIRSWTAEENRHGDTLNKYLYLSGRVNMREVEITTQHLISDGFDIGTASDPYKNFVYTSFQELATYISHNNVAKIARKKGHKALAKMSKIIAGDEMRHHVAYTEFVRQIFAIDPSEMMLAFQHMMKHKIVMPALHLRESFSEKGSLFANFSTVAQRAGVYTGFDYIDILRKLNAAWEIEKITGLTAEAEKARDYLLKLPDRMYRITERIVIPKTKFQFKWLNPI
ncbi:MAG: acyl-ACP desaturase [Polaribacter sp.]|jgi:acyl-[acyl-carrier-protein] desaturase|nr:acyl-ACP desaturase [Polaribacter sp.]MBT5099593.1 acyl-ACP desaturase [Polaribacter sp.]MBT5644932.1 acyl-ACP desaturase [Polaribacter sp.]MBT7704306.1 acyl-ACP desaturase [Polaribacter sp.]MDG1110534.1 acyl-ACP desaturase [Polaribacter sp.]